MLVDSALVGCLSFALEGVFDAVPEDQDEDHEDPGGEEVPAYADVCIALVAEDVDVHSEKGYDELNGVAESVKVSSDIMTRRNLL